MNKNYFLGLILFSILFVSACTAPQPAGQVAAGQGGQQVNTVQQGVSPGINRGQVPPDFTIKTVDGKEFTLSQLNAQDKPVLLYFWASWCPFCKRDFAAVEGVYPKFADQVIFLAIDLDTTEGANIIRQYRDSRGLQAINFAPGNGKVLSDFQVTSTTTKYAIGKDGVILYKGSGAFNEQQWETLFNALAAN
jgi:thiol-disulfide isomerase/thioredoxin